jgi:hypothetical protein
MIKFFIFSLLCVTLAACTKKPGYHVEESKVVKIEELAEDIKVPSKAWDLLEFKTVSEEAPAAHGEEKHAEGGEGGGHGEGEGKAAPAKTFTFSDIIVHLVQKNEGIVEGEAVKIHLPKGGGSIDLSRYITSQQGSFYVGIEYPAFETATAKKVVFVSRTRKRKIGAEVFGAGCNQVFDITDRFQKEMAGEGLKVNTTQERYISVIGGTFLFSAQKDNEVLLAQVTFTNPQYQHLFCEEK